jgi:hypothetical protein
MTGSELLESRSADGCCLTAIGSGAVAGLNMLSIAKVQTFELAGMQGSAMVSAGCGCSPSADSSVASNECHGKSGVNIDNQIPGEQVAFERVDHQDAFVANNQFWSDENQMRGKDQEKRPESGCCCRNEVALPPRFEGQNAANESDSCCVGVSASRPEDLFISHKPIIAGDK